MYRVFYGDDRLKPNTETLKHTETPEALYIRYICIKQMLKAAQLS